MIRIRKYRHSDFEPVARLVRKLFHKFVMPDASPDGVKWWTIFHSLKKENHENIIRRFNECSICFVAVDKGKIVGTVMGTTDEMVRLFVKESYHGRGVGKILAERFEKECKKMGSSQYRIIASLWAVPFYQKIGCRKTTGIRNLHGLKIQHMKKILE